MDNLGMVVLRVAVAAAFLGVSDSIPTRAGNTPTGQTEARAEARAEDGLQPIARIACKRITECSGIVRLDGAWFVHNDSGDAPVLYRSATLDFADTEILPLAGAEAVDWEDIAVLDGDLLIGDTGDNRCQRDHLVLYRARYHAPSDGQTGRLELVAAYPYRYPDGPHDAEALTVIDGVVYVITKARDEKATFVYRFDDLRDPAHSDPRQMNFPRRVATLDIGPHEEVTAADYLAASGTVLRASGTVALLTYRHILRYPSDHLSGTPVARTPIVAGQCEALCFDGDRLVIANEGRDVFSVDLQRFMGPAVEAR
jgi:hypothetical protein